MNDTLNQYDYWKKRDKTTFKHRDTDTTIKIYPLIDTASSFNATIGAFAMKNGEELVVRHEGNIDEFEEKLAAWMENHHYKEGFEE